MSRDSESPGETGPNPVVNEDDKCTSVRIGSVQRNV